MKIVGKKKLVKKKKKKRSQDLDDLFYTIRYNVDSRQEEEEEDCKNDGWR